MRLFFWRRSRTNERARSHDLTPITTTSGYKHPAMVGPWLDLVTAARLQVPPSSVLAVWHFTAMHPDGTVSSLPLHAEGRN